MVITKMTKSITEACRQMKLTEAIGHIADTIGQGIVWFYWAACIVAGIAFGWLAGATLAKIVWGIVKTWKV